MTYTITQITTILHYYAQLGFSVIPMFLSSGKDGKPVQNCFAVPWKEYQSRHATQDELSDWAKRFTNFAIVTGNISRLWVLDVDGEAGQHTLKQLIAQYGALPHTVMTRTRRGVHYYFTNPSSGIITNLCSKTALGDSMNGIDVRGDGGCACAYPSMHPSGVQYKWLHSPFNTHIAPAPDWLLKLVVQPERPARQSVTLPTIRRTDGNGSAYGLAALEREFTIISHAVSGTQETTLNKGAFAIGQLVAGNELNASYALSALTQAGLQMTLSGRPWTAQEVTEKIKRAMQDGAAMPRTAPASHYTSSYKKPCITSTYAGTQ